MIPASGKSPFKIENNLFNQQVIIRVKYEDREEFNQSLNVKVKMHAQLVKNTQ